MIFHKLRNWFTGRRRSAGPEAIRYLHPQEEFQGLLQNERKRADRSHTTFSLLVFTPADNAQRDVSIEILAERLKHRLRTTDTAGFLDDSQIAVILPGTPDREAWKIAADVTSPAANWTVPAQQVFTYPSQRPLHMPDNPSSAETTPKGQPLEVMFIQQMPAWKRGMDIVGSTVGLIVLSPLLLLTAAAIKLTSNGPVLFCQRREGLGGKIFTIYKFRTMCVDAESQKAALRPFSEQDGPAFKLKNDPRITTIGRFLRKSCIDELPQLFNVLRGEMSLVGPRPLPCDESRQCSSWERRRLEVTPGLTCIWQVYGKSRVTFAEWMRMDLRYMKGRTILHDAKLVWQTALAVVFHRASH